MVRGYDISWRVEQEVNSEEWEDLWAWKQADIRVSIRLHLSYRLICRLRKFDGKRLGQFLIIPWLEKV